MPIKSKITGLKRGSKGYVYKIPLSELGNIKVVEINKHLKEIYGTNKIKIDYNIAGRENLTFKDFFSLIDSGSKIKSWLGKEEPFIKKGHKGRRFRLIFEDAERTDKGWNSILVTNDGKNIQIGPVSVLHGITGLEYYPEAKTSNSIYGNRTEIKDTYSDLISILKTGFKRAPNRHDDENVNIKYKKNTRTSMRDGFGPSWAQKNEKDGVTKGDRYTLEFIPSHGEIELDYASYTPPENILSVNIELDNSISDKEKQKKMSFYKKNIGSKYKIPVRFMINEGKEELTNISPKKQKLEQKISGTIAIISLIGSLFFLGSNITGNIIGNLTKTNSNWTGIILLSIGLITGFSLAWVSNGRTEAILRPENP